MNFVRAHAKAIAGLVTTVVVIVAAKHGVHLDPDLEATLGALLVALMVYAIPNKPAAA